MTPADKVTIELEVRELDFILQVLSTQPLPLVQTQPIIQKIVSQANSKNPDAASDQG